MNMPMKLIGATALLAALVLAGRPALGQNALGDGTGLSNSLQTTGGGPNDGGAQPFDYRVRNDVITGNVTGSSFFRGNVNYRAPGEFTGTLGSDSQQQFRNETAPGSVQAIMSRSFGIGAPPTRAMRDISGVSAGDVMGGGGSSTPFNALSSSRGDTGASLYDTGIFTSAPNQAVRRTTSDSLGRVQDQSGRLLEINASPLFGVTQRAIPRDVLGIGMPDESQQRNPLPDIDETPATTTAAPSGLGQVISGAPLSPAVLGYIPTEISPAMQLGLQLQSLQQGAPTAAAAQKLDQRAQQIEATIFGPIQRGEVTPGKDAYLDLLAQMQRQRDGTAPQTNGESRPAIDLTNPTSEQLAAAEKARQQATQGQGDDATQPAGAPRPEAMNKLIDALDHNLPAVRTLAGDTEDLTNRLMREAEVAMATGKFFDAERHYERVLDLKSGYPLARAGLVHAQLGAGLVRSAALNLRNLFAAHPELIAVRYQTNLLPNQERLDWVRGQIQDMIDRTTHEEPALLMAYVGYQAGNQELTRYGLNLAQARAPSDPLVPLLREIWLREKPADASDAQPDPQTPTPPAADSSK